MKRLISLSSYFKNYAYFEVFSLKKKCLKIYFLSLHEVYANNYISQNSMNPQTYNQLICVLTGKTVNTYITCITQGIYR